MRYRVLANPVAGGGRGRAVGRRVESELGSECDLVWSESGDDLEAAARAATAEGLDRVIAVGGDGTFNRVIRGLAGSDVELGLVPAGTGNDLPACLGIPRRTSGAIELARQGVAGRLDLGRAAKVPFAVYAGVGFDSEVAEWITARGPGKKNKLVYVTGALRGLGRFVPPRMKIEYDGGEFDGRAMFATIANCFRFGGGMRIAPGARPDDGALDLVIVREVSKLAFLRVFPSVFTGRHLDHPAVSHHSTRRVRIRVDRPMTLFGDGEPISPLDWGGVEVGVEPLGLSVVRGSQSPL